MHDFLTGLKPDLLLNCNQDDPYLGCDDIIISTPTVWQDQVVELCWKQNIVIEKTGSLKLINTKLTIGDPPSGSQSCPDIAQIHAWGGIYIEGRGVVNDIPPILTGNLYVESGSIIERSHYGISAPYGFGEIIISNSTIQNSGRFIYAIGRFDPTDIQTSLPPLPPPPSSGEIMSASPCSWFYASNPQNTIKIINSTLTSDDLNHPAQTLDFLKTQIHVNEASLLVSNSIIENNSGLSLIAIKSGSGSVNITNASKIIGYPGGIIKEPDYLAPCHANGLVIYNSSLINCAKAVDNRSAYMALRKCYFQNSNIESNGMGYNSIVENYFLGTSSLWLRNIEIFSTVRGNKLKSSYLAISQNNQGTLALCNEWETVSGPCLEIAAQSVLPVSWGTQDMPSGNKHDNNPKPGMYFYGGSTVSLRNYYYPMNVLEQFTYFGQIEGAFANTSASHCSYGMAPTSPPVSAHDFPYSWGDMDSLDTRYQYIDSVLTSESAKLSFLSGTPLARQQEVVAQISIERKQVVADALVSLSLIDDSTGIANTWYGRVAPSVLDLSWLQYYFLSQSFDSIYSIAYRITDPDFDVFIEACDILSDIKSSGRGIFELLESEVDTLATIAQLSFGNYTNILRSLLDVKYHVYIPWPQEVFPRSSVGEAQQMEPIKNTAGPVYRYKISPNPVTNSFVVHTIAGISDDHDDLLLDLFDLSGRLIQQYISKTNTPTPLNHFAPGLYLVKIVNIEHGFTETHRIFAR